MKSIFRRCLSYLADLCAVFTIAFLSYTYQSQNQIGLSIFFLVADLCIVFLIGFHYGNDAHRVSISRKLDELSQKLTETTKDNN